MPIRTKTFRLIDLVNKHDNHIKNLIGIIHSRCRMYCSRCSFMTYWDTLSIMTLEKKICHPWILKNIMKINVKAGIVWPTGWQKWWKTIEVGSEKVGRCLVELADIKPGSRVLGIAT